MISKCITPPMNQTECDYARLNEFDKEVLKFHRDCFGVGDDGWINDIYFNQVVKKHNDHQSYYTLCQLTTSSMSTGTRAF